MLSQNSGAQELNSSCLFPVELGTKRWKRGSEQILGNKHWLPGTNPLFNKPPQSPDRELATYLKWFEKSAEGPEH